MNLLFRSRCEALVRDCVNSSVDEKRESDRAELLRNARFEQREERRLLRRRVKSLEQDVRVLVYQQERMRAQLSVNDEFIRTLGNSTERRLADAWVRLACSYGKLRSTVDDGWTSV
jgi:hypothetical protein